MNNGNNKAAASAKFKEILEKYIIDKQVYAPKMSDMVFWARVFDVTMID